MLRYLPPGPIVILGLTVQYRTIVCGGNYLSHNDPRVHFGLSKRDMIDRIEIQWPSGTVERLTQIMVNWFLVIAEGKGIVS